MSEAGSDKAPPIFEPEMRTLTVTVKSLEGLNFATELGNQQIAVSILFPGHNNDTMSPLLPPAPKISFDFTENYQIQFYLQLNLMIHLHKYQLLVRNRLNLIFLKQKLFLSYIHR